MSHSEISYVLIYSVFFFFSFVVAVRESAKKSDNERENKSILAEVKKYAAKGKAVTHTNRSLYPGIAELDDLFRPRKFANYFRYEKPNKHRKRS